MWTVMIIACGILTIPHAHSIMPILIFVGLLAIVAGSLSKWNTGD